MFGGAFARCFVLFIQQKAIELRGSVVSSELTLSAGQPVEDGQLSLRLHRLAASDYHRLRVESTARHSRRSLLANSYAGPARPIILVPVCTIQGLYSVRRY